jgi:hypothetical protein
MTDPAKLMLSARTGFTRTLLQSAQGDHSAPGAAQRALLALSAGASVAAVSAAAKASSVSAAMPANASAGIAGKWAGVLSLKWLALGLLAGSATLLAVDTWSRPQRAVSALNQAATAAPTRNASPSNAVALPLSPPLPSASSDLLAPSPELVRRAAIAPPLNPSAGHAQAAPEVTSDALAELQAVRAALAAHDPQRALTLLDTFERRQQSGTLVEEASVLRIEALVDAGRPEASTLGTEFLRLYPHSAYAPRVRAKLQLP